MTFKKIQGLTRKSLQYIGTIKLQNKFKLKQKQIRPVSRLLQAVLNFWLKITVCLGPLSKV